MACVQANFHESTLKRLNYVADALGLSRSQAVAACIAIAYTQLAGAARPELAREEEKGE